MKKYILNHNGKEMEVIESEVAFNSHDGMFFDLPNDTEIFITKSCVSAMQESFGMMDTVYEGVSVSDAFPAIEDGSESFEKDGR